MPFIEDLIQTLDARIKALRGEIASLEQARVVLTSDGSASDSVKRAKPRAGRRDSQGPRTRRTARRKTTKPNRRARSSPVLVADEAERLLASTNGLSTAALATQAGAKHDQVLALLRDLEKARRVRRSGERQGTRWHAITDEDRIQERAAELAARSRRQGS